MDSGSEKPFKTIEVVDSRTNQVCKVACMSCIRGHRTTACGIPVCRNKIFWTVKRPGRPSNSCTCRYGATGGCKCVVATSACPHKAKKGEKRSGECRCDEQGRYCCLIEPDHWTALFALQKPTVEFCPTREDLETKQAASASVQHISPSPGHVMPNPAGVMSVPSTPGPNMPPQIMPSPYNAFTPQSSSLTPRFGVMGLGAPRHSLPDVPLDLLTWGGDVSHAPIDYPQHYSDTGNSPEPCCQTSTSSAPPLGSPQPIAQLSYSQQQPLHDLALPQAFDVPGDQNVTHATVVPTTLPATQSSIFDIEKLQSDFYTYRLPSAICQSCGYGGCNCKNCPPLFQNPFDGSWAQCCGRKHAREPQTTPEPRKVPRSSGYDGSEGIQAHARIRQPAGNGGGCCGSSVDNSNPSAATTTTTNNHHHSNHNGDHTFQPEHAYTNDFANLEHQPNMIPTDFDSFVLEPDFVLDDGGAHLDIADYLNLDLDAVPQSHNHGEEPPGAASGGTNGSGGGIGGGGGGGGVGGSGGGGCCCGGGR